MLLRRAHKRSSSGLEKKISKSIIWVGIVPMLLVAVVVGVISVTSMHRSALSELESKAGTLAEALEMAIGSRIELSETIAKAPELLDALANESASAEPEKTGARPRLEEYLDRLVSDQQRQHLGISVVDTHGNVVMSDGRLHGLLEARARYLQAQLDRFDTLAAGLIYEVNRIHSAGGGLVGYQELLSEYSVDDPTASWSGWLPAAEWLALGPMRPTPPRPGCPPIHTTPRSRPPWGRSRRALSAVSSPPWA